MKTLKDIGECAAIDRLLRFLPRRRDVVVGAGDDCAVVRSDDRAAEDWLLTSDPVIEGVHFSLGTPPSAVGHKAVGRVLSDLAAMGGRPLWALVDVAAPSHTPVDTLESMYAGLAALADQHGLAVVGGDMAEAPVLELHVFAVGSVPRDAAILRSGAAKEDGLFVTGALGGSLAGKHLSFQPRLREGVWLRDWAASMIDVSDGLASDLRHIVDMSNVGALLDVGRVPCSPVIAREPPDVRVRHVLHDGEDFELLFTVRAPRLAAFQQAWAAAFDLECTRIGTITDRRGVIECLGPAGDVTLLEKKGFQHFGQPQ